MVTHTARHARLTFVPLDAHALSAFKNRLLQFKSVFWCDFCVLCLVSFHVVFMCNAWFLFLCFYFPVFCWLRVTCAFHFLYFTDSVSGLWSFCWVVINNINTVLCAAGCHIRGANATERSLSRFRCRRRWRCQWQQQRQQQGGCVEVHWIGHKHQVAQSTQIYQCDSRKAASPLLTLLRNWQSRLSSESHRDRRRSSNSVDCNMRMNPLQYAPCFGQLLRNDEIDGEC